HAAERQHPLAQNYAAFRELPRLLNLTAMVGVNIEDGLFHLPDYRGIGIRREAAQTPRADAHLAQRQFHPVQFPRESQKSLVSLGANLRQDLARLLENRARNQGLSFLEARK